MFFFVFLSFSCDIGPEEPQENRENELKTRHCANGTECQQREYDSLKPTKKRFLEFYVASAPEENFEGDLALVQAL